jgi:hypothetical protein
MMTVSRAPVHKGSNDRDPPVAQEDTMSATRTVQAYPGTQQWGAALGVAILAAAVMVVLAIGVLSAPKATISSPSSGAAPALFDHGSISDPANVSAASGSTRFDNGSISDPANVSVPASDGGSNRLRLPR